LLTPFDPTLSEAARSSLESLGVEVRLGSAVSECNCDGVRVANDFIPSRTVVWAAGVMASPAGRWLGAETDRAGRVKVRSDLTIAGHPEVFVMGDTAAATAADGSMLPGVAPVAKQQGQYVARALIARHSGQNVGAFRYQDFGSLATIGRKRAVAQFGKLRLSGFLAWILWSIAHVYFLIGFRNRFVVALNWAWSYITFQRGSRLITGLYAPHLDDMSHHEPVRLRSKAS
jgi:NADH dehydrogenase